MPENIYYELLQSIQEAEDLEALGNLKDQLFKAKLPKSEFEELSMLIEQQAKELEKGE